MRTVRLLAFLCLTATFAANAKNTTLLGNSYAPPGAGYTIFSLQGIDMSHMFGDGSSSSQVNIDFEFDGGIGVSYDSGGGKGLTDFGIGLYQSAQSQTFSTGLRVRLDQPAFASSITLTLADFDISQKDTFFNSKKVEPSILILGAGGVVIATASPTDIFPDLVFDSPTGKKGKGSKADVWDLNLGKLLASLHLADTTITGYVLFADTKNGEKANSDPYFFISQSVVSQTTNP